MGTRAERQNIAIVNFGDRPFKHVPPEGAFRSDWACSVALLVVADAV